MEVVDEAEEPVTDEGGHISLPPSYRLSVDDRHRLLTTGAANALGEDPKTLGEGFP
jgi:hypothetical protein